MDGPQADQIREETVKISVHQLPRTVLRPMPWPQLPATLLLILVRARHTRPLVGVARQSLALPEHGALGRLSDKVAWAK